MEHQQITEHIIRLKIPYKDIYTTILIIKTDDGFVLFDTATYEEDITQRLIPALNQLKIKREEIKYIFISHNHGDHSGGLNWLAPMLPDATIISNSPSLTEKYAPRTVRHFEDGERFAGCLQYVSIPGHTPDAGGLLDLRTKTLMTGDALQVYGIYGSGKWGANIKWPEMHFDALLNLHKIDADLLIMAHDYHPWGNTVQGKENINRCIDDCEEAILKIKSFISNDLDADNETLATRYNEQSGLPKISAKLVNAIRLSIENEKK